MLKNKIELMREGECHALLTWHKPDGEGGTIPIAIEFFDPIDDETRQRVEDITKRPMNSRQGGKLTKVFPGSSKHFQELPKVLGRLGYRTRQF